MDPVYAAALAGIELERKINPQLTPAELDFYKKARHYVSLWIRDFRNTNDPERIMLELARARNDLYNAFYALEPKEDK